MQRAVRAVHTDSIASIEGDGEPKFSGRFMVVDEFLRRHGGSKFSPEPADFGCFGWGHYRRHQCIRAKSLRLIQWV